MADGEGANARWVRLQQIKALVKRIDMSGYPVKMTPFVGELWEGVDKVTLGIDFEVGELYRNPKDLFVGHLTHRVYGIWRTDEEIVRAIRNLAVLVVVHELDEHFLFDGKRFWEPHMHGNQQVGLCMCQVGQCPHFSGAAAGGDDPLEQSLQLEAKRKPRSQAPGV